MATAARTGSARPLPPREAPRALAAPRSEDPDFSLKNRLILAALKASHHLNNAEGRGNFRYSKLEILAHFVRKVTPIELGPPK